MSDASGAIGAIVVGVVLNFWMSPQHSHTTGVLSYAPEPGYTWQNPNDFGPFRHAVWTPGTQHPRVTHIFADSREGWWLPEDGYAWRYDRDHNPISVAWQAGLGHTRLRHVSSSSREGYWHTDPGYAYYSRVSPSSLAPTTEKQFAGSTGYLSASLTDVRWRPGSRHPSYPHIYAGYREGYWSADSGYHFVSTTGLRVESDGPDWAQFWTSVFVGVVANDCATPRYGDDAFAANVGRPICGHVRDEAARSAINTLVGH